MRKIFAIRKLHSAIEEGKQTFAEYGDLVEALETVNLMLHNVALDTVLYSDIPDPITTKPALPRKTRTVETSERKAYVKVEPAILRPMLGTMPDKDIAESLGYSLGTVARYRRKWEIEPYKENNSRPRWTPEHEVMLGCDTDKNVAKLLGRTLAAVTQRRSMLGIPSYQQSRKALRENTQLLETFNNSEIAELLGIPKKVVDAAYNDHKTIDDVLDKS